MNDTFTLHNDPGHGWLEVSFSDLTSVGLELSDITSYSYKNRSGTRLFLEEDCDMNTFFKAYKTVHGEFPKYVESYDEEDVPEGLGLIGIRS